MKREGDDELVSQFLVNMAYVYNEKDVKRFEMLFAKETREIAELTWLGKDLIAKGRKEGRKQGERQALRTSESLIRSLINSRFPGMDNLPELSRLPDQETADHLIRAIGRARTRQQVRNTITELLPPAPTKRG